MLHHPNKGKDIIKQSTKNIEIHNNDIPTINNHSFIIKEVISTSWKFIKKYFWTIIVLFLITLIPSIIEHIFDFIIRQIPGATIYNTEIGTYEPVGIWVTISSIVYIIVGIVGAWLGLGYVRANLQILEDKKPPFSIITSTPWIRVARLIGGGILVGLVVLIGIIALIIPGIWIAVRLSLFQYYIAEGYGTIDSIKASWYATQDNFWKLSGIGLIYIGITLL